MRILLFSLKKSAEKVRNTVHTSWILWICYTYVDSQEPGDALYLPHGMPHAVYNLDDTVALTENYLFMGWQSVWLFLGKTSLWQFHKALLFCPDALPNLMRAVAEDDVRVSINISNWHYHQIRDWVPSWSEDKGIKTLYMQVNCFGRPVLEATKGTTKKF